MRSLLALLVGTVLGGCFNPDLGRNPFLCATTGKKCPDGYHCANEVCLKDDVTDGAVVVVDKRILTDAELMPSKEGPAYLDGAGVQSSKGCLDEQSEPNNSAAKATVIPVPLPVPPILPNWQICYPGDVDQYKVQVNMGQRLVVRVKFTHSKGDLDAALVDPTGMVIDASRGITNEETLTLPFADKDGNYVFGVYGFGPATNTYDLEITLSDG